MKVKKGDKVLIITGKDKGKTGKITKSFPRDGKVLIEGVNLRNRRIKPKKQGEKGQTVKVPVPMNVSNIKLICPKCGKAARTGYKISEGKKGRICKKCQSEI